MAVGAWGPAIFSDDLAADVRDDFRDLIADGADAADATARVTAEYGDAFADEDEAAVFRLALAAVQWDLGFTTEGAQRDALRTLDAGAGLRRWEEVGGRSLAARRAHLRKLRAKLDSPPPPPKRPRRRRKLTTGLHAGDVGVFAADGVPPVRFWVSGLMTDRGGTYAHVRVSADPTAYSGAAVTAGELTASASFTMLSREPAGAVSVERRGVPGPAAAALQEVHAAWNRRALAGGGLYGFAATWPRLEETLPTLLPNLRGDGPP